MEKLPEDGVSTSANSGETYMPRTGKILLGISVLWFALDVCLVIVHGAALIPSLASFITVSLVFSYVGIPVLLVIGLFMVMDTKSKKIALENKLPGGEKFNTGEVVAVIIIFLAGLIIPAVLANNYMAAHPGAVSSPGYISTIGFWTNLVAFLFAVSLFRRQSKWTRGAAIILVVLSVLYFFVLLIGFLLSGFIG